MLSAAPLAVTGFAGAWMLWWALAATIPLALHLLNRRKQRVAPWAAMQLLRKVVEQESRRIRIEQLILLMLRILIPLLLAFALARPYWTADTATPLAEETTPRLWVVAIDVSYSMGYRENDRSRFAIAKSQAEEILRGGVAGDTYMLVALSAPSRAIVSRPTFDREAVLNELRRLELLDTGLDVEGGLRLVQDVVKEAVRTAGVPSEVGIVIMSDLGKDSWQGAAADASVRILNELGQEYFCQVLSLADDSTENIAITGFQPSVERAIAGASFDVDVRIENFSRNAVEQLPLELKLNGQPLESRTVDLRPGGTLNVRLSTAIETTGPAILTATIPPDRLGADDSRDHIVEVTDRYRILLVESQPGNARPLSLVLEPELQFGNSQTGSQSGSQSAGRRSVTIVSAAEFLAMDLRPWDAVVLSDLRRITQNAIQRLSDFTADGGAVLLMLGPNTDLEVWNGWPESESWLGYRLQEPSEQQLWSLDPLEYRSPVVSPFEGYPDAGLLTTPIFQYWKTTPKDGGDLEVDLAIAGGDPLILRHRYQRGWVASVLSAPQSGAQLNDASMEAWNAMVTWPSFLPLMQRLVQVVLASSADEANLLTGQPIRGQIANATGDKQVRVLLPDGAQEVLLPELVTRENSRGSPQEAGWILPRTYHRGTYRVSIGDGPIQPYAVNIRPTESSLESIDPRTLPVSVQRPLPGRSSTSDLSAPQTGDGLARWLLTVLAGLLIAETTLAWFLGRRVG